MRLDAPTFGCHPPEGVVDQLLTGDLVVFQPAQVRLADYGQRAALGLAQGSDLFHFDQVAFDHFLDGSALAIGALDGAGLGELGFAFLHPGLYGLFAGEGLGLLVDLRTVLFDADLGGVADTTACTGSYSNGGYGEGGKSHVRSGKTYCLPCKTVVLPRKIAVNK